MEVKHTKTTKVIPEHTIIEDNIMYIALDGKEFLYQRDCEKYEERLLASRLIQDIPHKKIERYDDEYPYDDWYFIRDKEDAQVLKNYYKLRYSTLVIGQWNGIGWRDGGDSGDYYDSTTLNEELTEIERVAAILKTISE